MKACSKVLVEHLRLRRVGPDVGGVVDVERDVGVHGLHGGEELAAGRPEGGHRGGGGGIRMRHFEKMWGEGMHGCEGNQAEPSQTNWSH
jgi:hypothetical protein